MEKEKLKQKRGKKSKIVDFLKEHFSCMAFNESENSDLSESEILDLRPKSIAVGAEKSKVSPIRRKKSLFYVKNLEESSETAPDLTNAFKDVPVQTELASEEESTIENVNYEGMDREKKDQLIKTILSKYLEVKRSELDKNPVEPEPTDIPTFHERRLSDLQERDLDIEYFSSTTSSNTTVVDPSSSSHQEVSIRANAEFPIKTRSAPTTSTAHDSLADICSKLCRYKQESDSYVTCCSEISNSKKKLELIFDQSSEEISSNEDCSTVSLQYKISCERTGTQRPDSVLRQYKDEKNYHVLKGFTGSNITSQELHLQPSAKGEIGGYNGSTSSLKWKLIISHHGGITKSIS